MEGFSDRLLGRNVTAALLFEDANAAREILATLTESPAIRSAILTTSSGSRLATYSSEFEPSPVVPATNADTVYADDRLWALEPIDHDGARIGHLAIASDLGMLKEQLRVIMVDAGLTCALSLAIALLVALRLGRSLVRPITELARLAESVSHTHDYRLRAKVTTEDELGQLTTTINQMLYRIEEQNSQLVRWGENLEDRVTERTRDLREATEAAEAASRAKTDFLANMSHEIRTPMTAILGFVEILLNENLTTRDRQEYMNTVRQNGEHLMSVINDILDLSRIEANQLTCNPGPCHLGDFFGEVDSLFAVRARSAGLDFEIALETPVPYVITSDRVRLRQIMINLVGNALKFTQTGSIRIRAGMRATDDATPRLTISVTDTGVGMSSEQLARLFKPFVQADETVTRRFGGTGLGLCISKRLAALLGGSVTVTSAAGVGSTFQVSIDPSPVDLTRTTDDLDELLADARPKSAQPATAAEPEDDPLSGMRVLLAEDGPDNQRLIRFILTRAGALVSVAANGAEAIDQWRESSEEDPFDVILMDMQMPVLDGYAATRQLRRLGCQLPILALTAHSMEGDRARCLAAGCSGYATKPIHKATLFSLLREHAGLASSTEDTVGAGPPPRG